MKTCSYTGCDLLVMRSDTYLDWRGNERTDGFCDHHWKEHVSDLAKAEEDLANDKPYESRGKRERRPRVVQPCGTTAAFQRHIRAGDERCDPCWAAAKDQNAARRAQKKRRAA